MCGIFGTFGNQSSPLSRNDHKNIFEELFMESNIRGGEASGVAAIYDNEVNIFKRAESPSKFLKNKKYRQLWNKFDQGPYGIIGHTRMVTNGEQGLNSNNQPVSSDEVVAIHNGIVVNVDDLWKAHPDYSKNTDVDTEVIVRIVTESLYQGASVQQSVNKAFREVYGMTNLCLLFSKFDSAVLATNNGSLYYCITDSNLFFASEYRFLRESLEKVSSVGEFRAEKLEPGTALLFNLGTFKHTIFNIETDSAPSEDSKIEAQKEKKRKISDESDEIAFCRDNMKRCTKCILPETMPFIEFDEHGVCNFCRNYSPIQLKGHDALVELAQRHKKTDGSPDCVVAFSGGRDSSYGLHYLKKELGLNPVAYTYDWGMVTDLARRNQSRLCGKLGVEHILVSADIKTKRSYVRKNLHAWLKDPDLGMVPILMAGDKQYFYYANRVAKDFNTDLTFFCGNPMEKTSFKSGFCGIPENQTWYYNVSIFQKFRMGFYYLKHYLRSPSYFNASLVDTLFAYYASYFLPHNYELFFDYLPWNEEQINSTLKSEYDWEFAADTDNSWRIGDGTAAFYNYIYYTIAGFTEFDTFKSIQIREELIDRQSALDEVSIANTPRFDSIREYARVIGFDFDYAVSRISSVPKLYMKN